MAAARADCRSAVTTLQTGIMSEEEYWEGDAEYMDGPMDGAVWNPLGMDGNLFGLLR